MSWAARRRFFILLIIGLSIVAFLAILSVATFYRTPSCTDNVQNQGETGVDCGGPCAYLCTEQEQPPTVLFTQVLPNGGGTDIIASVENKNTSAAARNVPYRVSLYSADRVLVQEISGTLDLPPGATVPVFLPGITSGKQTVVTAFLTIEASSPKWFALAADPRVVPLVSNTNQVGTANNPRIEAMLSNPSVTALTNVQAIVLVRDEGGTVIAASRTVVPLIPAQGQSMATFTWNVPFPGTPATIEVIPIIPLP